MTSDEHADRLLERIGVLRHPSDLDLLIFFSGHPRSLLASEQLAAFLGYSIAEIAASLDLLVDAGLVTRSQSSRHAARLFMLTAHARGDGSFTSLLEVASTRHGRLALRAALRRRSTNRGGAGERATTKLAAHRGRRPFMVRRQPGPKRSTAG